MAKSKTIMSFCPHCGNRIRINQVQEKGGGHGGWVLECVSCRKPFHKHLGSDIEMSSVIGGALVLATYEDDVRGSKIGALERFGLSSKSQKAAPPARPIRRSDSAKLAKLAAKPYGKV
jgi:hypothetical protein